MTPPLSTETPDPPAAMPPLVFIDNEGITDPHVNLAIEEYALRHLDPAYTYLLFYVNEPSVIIGRNQNALEEIDQGYVKERGIHVVRRLSGGGAVYHDGGNLNFSFITDYGADRLHNFDLFTEPVVRVLNEMGAPAELRGRNDLVVDGRKVSGNAQYSTPRRMFSHGTLLLNSDLDEVSNVLRVGKSKVESKGHASVRSRVANIVEYAEREVDVPAFRERLLRGIFRSGEVPIYRLSGRDWEGVRRLHAERYARWEWNAGASPPFSLRRSRRFAFGEVDVRLDVRKGTIEDVRIFGDFLGVRGVRPLEDRIRGTRYDREALQTALRPVDVSAFVRGLSEGDFLDLLTEA